MRALGWPHEYERPDRDDFLAFLDSGDSGQVDKPKLRK